MRRLLPLLLCGCAGTTLPIVPLDTRTNPSFATVEQACALWEIECYPTRNRIGAITLVITDRGAAPLFSDETYVAGIEPGDDTGCKQLTWAQGKHTVVAHELGHALGLGHHPEPGNVMHKSRGGEWVTDEQRETVHTAVGALSLCFGRDDVP